MAPGPDDLSCLLGSSGVLQKYLAPKLTICQLLLVSQVCRHYRHSLRQEDVWQSAVRRSLPPGHPLTQFPTAGYRQAAYQFGRIQSGIKAGSAILRCGDVPRSPCLNPPRSPRRCDLNRGPVTAQQTWMPMRPGTSFSQAAIVSWRVEENRA